MSEVRKLEFPYQTDIEEAGTDKNIITKQIVMNGHMKSRLLPITADIQVANIIQDRITKCEKIEKELEEIYDLVSPLMLIQTSDKKIYPKKNTSKQDVYRAVARIKQILEVSFQMPMDLGSEIK
jgi:hypothetical protein